MAGAAKDQLHHKQEDILRLFHSPTDSTVQHSEKIRINRLTYPNVTLAVSGILIG